MHTRIGVQIAEAVALITALSIGPVAPIALTAQGRELIAQLTGSADLLSEPVRTTSGVAMAENHREKPRQQLETIGKASRAAT